MYFAARAGGQAAIPVVKKDANATAKHQAIIVVRSTSVRNVLCAQN